MYLQVESYISFTRYDMSEHIRPRDTSIGS
jgi:hypothetical protein